MRLWNTFIKLFTEVIPVLLLVVVTVIITADVVARTVFNKPVFAAAEIGLIAFVWLVWLGTVAVARQGEMMGISYFVERLGRFRQPAMILSDILVIGICAFSTYASYRQVSTARFTIFDTLHLPKWILAVGVGLSFFCLTLVYCNKLLRVVRGRSPATISPEDPL